jgi:hypothetical protein
VSVLGHWRDPAIDDPEIAWVRAGAARIAAHSRVGGGYLNYGAPDEPADRVRAAFGDAKYERLRAIKHRSDPGNVSVQPQHPARLAMNVRRQAGLGTSPWLSGCG